MGFPQLELLRQLINVETNQMKLLQLVLFAQEELRAKLAHARGRNLRSRIVMASTLERLSAQELADTPAFRWNVASGGGQHPFAEEALQALFEYSQGIPREATILAVTPCCSASTASHQSSIARWSRMQPMTDSPACQGRRPALADSDPFAGLKLSSQAPAGKLEQRLFQAEDPKPPVPDPQQPKPARTEPLTPIAPPAPPKERPPRRSSSHRH